MKLANPVLWTGVACLLFGTPGLWAASTALAPATKATHGRQDAGDVGRAVRLSGAAATPTASTERAAASASRPTRLLVAQQPPGAAAAAGAEVEGGLKVGVVDTEAVRAGWAVVEELQKKKELVEQVAPRVMQEELDYRQQLVFFTEDEVEEAVKLWAARRERRANEQELKLLSTREQEAGDRARKFQQLVTKETLTEEEKRELAFLREIRAGRLEQLQQLERAYEQQMARLRQSYQDADRRAFEELRKAAQRVGERLGMDLVFTSEALLFGGISITQDVIDDLQANVPSLAAIGGVAEEGAAP